MRIEEAVTKAWATVLTEKILQEVMSGLQQMKFDVMLSGGDSGLKNVWEEICAQVQIEESFFWDAYLETLEAAIEARLNELDHAALLALWSITDSGWSWIYDHHGDSDGDQEAPIDPCEIIRELRGKLISVADEYTNRNLSRHRALHYGYDEYEDTEDEDDDEDFDDDYSEDDDEIDREDQESHDEHGDEPLDHPNLAEMGGDYLKDWQSCAEYSAFDLALNGEATGQYCRHPASRIPHSACIHETQNLIFTRDAAEKTRAFLRKMQVWPKTK